MAAWRYEISLRVLKKYFTRSHKCFFYYINTNEIPNYFTLIAELHARAKRARGRSPIA